MRYVLLASILTLVATCGFGTTVVYIVSPEGIVMAADSRIKTGTGTRNDGIKLVLLKNRIAVAATRLIGLRETGYDVEASRVVYVIEYSFQDWIRSIEESPRANVTVSDVCSAVEHKAALAFRNVDILMKAGVFEQNDAGDDVLARYLIAGYESGLPAVYQVEFQIDRGAKRITGPTRLRIHPLEGEDALAGVNASGSKFAIREVLERKGRGYQRALSLASHEVQKLLKQQDLSLHEATTLARVLIQIEAESSPRDVALPVRLVGIPRSGAATLSIYADALIGP